MRLLNVKPRYLRVGVNPSTVPPVVKYLITVTEQLNSVESDGSLAVAFTNKIDIPASDHYSKWKLEDFKLASMLENGVKLDYINIASQNGDLSRINSIADKLDSLESYAKLVEKQRSEISDFFKNPSVEPSKSLENE